MSSFFRYLRSFFSPSTNASASSALRPIWHSTNPILFSEGDRLLVDGKLLTSPLRKRGQHNTPRGFINHDEIIGRPAVRSLFATNTNFRHEICLPSLDEYVSLTPRKVTPVYASYASLIVSLLDIHVPPPTPHNAPSTTNPPLEILEAGTGHGSLTLHLARAIAAANPSTTPPFLPDESYTLTRRALLHSVELSPAVSQHAQKLIAQFRQGLYLPHIAFHVSPLASWLHSQSHRGPFLSHVLLDLPGVTDEIGLAAQALRHGGLLTVFAPSVTQIADCVGIVRRLGLGLRMERVVELGEGISNGRYWDVRLVNRRSRGGGVEGEEENMAKQRRGVRGRRESSRVIGPQENVAESESDAGMAGERVDAGEERAVSREVYGVATDAVVESVPQDTSGEQQPPVFVCRPKVGRMTMGGGFVGMWRKIDWLTTDSQKEE